MLRTTILLTLTTFVLTGMTARQQNATIDFQAKVDRFEKKYLANYTISKENLDGTGQQYTLDTKSQPIWRKKTTLKGKTSFRFNTKQRAYQRLYLSFYQYETSTQRSAALDSLLNCFGGGSGKLVWGVNGKSAKTSPCIYIINEKEIVACHIDYSYQNGIWEKFKYDLEKSFGNESSGIIESGCGGPINFRAFCRWFLVLSVGSIRRSTSTAEMPALRSGDDSMMRWGAKEEGALFTCISDKITIVFLYCR